jgi:hypothetical protein
MTVHEPLEFDYLDPQLSVAQAAQVAVTLGLFGSLKRARLAISMARGENVPDQPVRTRAGEDAIRTL